MRSLWVRIGVGAGVIFLAGMFLISLGRHVTAQVTEAVRTGGTISVPLALLPFQVDRNRVGSVRRVDVRRVSPGGARRINIEVRLKGAEAAERYAHCLFHADAPERAGLFACVPEGSAEAGDLVAIGEVRIEPEGIVRPIVISSRRARDWFEDAGTGEFHLQAGPRGVMLHAADAAGGKRVELLADSTGALLDVRDDSGRKVVQLRAGSGGLKLEVTRK